MDEKNDGWFDEYKNGYTTKTSFEKKAIEKDSLKEAVQSIKILKLDVDKAVDISMKNFKHAK